MGGGAISLATDVGAAFAARETDDAAINVTATNDAAINDVATNDVATNDVADAETKNGVRIFFMRLLALT